MSESRGSWSEIAIAGHPCGIYEPSQPSEHGYVVLYLHGVHEGRLQDHPEFAELFGQYGLRAICPTTRQSWWTDKVCEQFDPNVTAERYVLDQVVPHIHKRWGTVPPQIALLGTSMGGQGALRFAFKHPDTFPIAAAISPAIDYHLCFDEGYETLPLMYPNAEAVRQDTATLHIHPLYWPRNIWFCCDPNDLRWHTAAERLRMKLAALGIPYDADLDTIAGGHGFPYYNHMAAPAIRYLTDRLDHERLRVV